MQTRACTRCKEEKPLDQFCRSPLGKFGREPRCKVCKKAYYDVHTKRPEVRKRHKDGHRRRRYGITPAEYDRRMKEQNGLCEICGNQCPIHDTLSVDHHHSSGIIRGLLCQPCNVGLGRFNEDPERLRRAAAYLEKNAKAKATAYRRRMRESGPVSSATLLSDRGEDR